MVKSFPGADGQDDCRSSASPAFSRRVLLKGLGAAAAGLLAGACQPSWPELPRLASTAVQTSAAHSQVAIAQAASYDVRVVRNKVQALLDGLGGLGDVVAPGDRIAIKVNLTGGPHYAPPPGFSATESYLTHPEVVRALGELLRDAGALELFIVEALYDAASYARFGYDDVAESLGATLVDLNDPYPYHDFDVVPVGQKGLVYDEVALNPVLQEVDVLVSVAKMKCHFECGVTHSMKNLIGLLPVGRYRLDEAHWWRSAVHGRQQETKQRIPRVILDLNRARPIHLAVIDGIKTAEGGEVPRGSFRAIQPGVLIAGKNAVSTDAVATAAMGFDPTVEPPAPPFLRSDNHLNLARVLGLGTNRLEEIELVGSALDEVRCQFEPSWQM
jgi:uncharacterized protein (DUF362 family)